MKIQISNYTPCGLVEFYDTVAREMGIEPTSEMHYDCTKIDIAENIQEGFYKFYAESAEAKALTESEITVGVTMMLAMSGPKVNHNLKANEVEVFAGFIC